MASAADLLKTLKAELRRQGITYARVAEHLGLSEASVKRLLANSRSAALSLERIEQVCTLLAMEVTDLAAAAANATPLLSSISAEQEQELVDHPPLLLTAVCILNGWSFDEVRRVYAFELPEATGLFTRLDRMGLIDLLPGNRYRARISPNFAWRPGGPIQQLFFRTLEHEFFNSRFDGPGEQLLFVNGMLSANGNAEVKQAMQRLTEQFSQLSQRDRKLPLEQRYGSSILVALRPWEPEVFSRYRRGPNTKVMPEKAGRG